MKTIFAILPVLILTISIADASRVVSLECSRVYSVKEIEDGKDKDENEETKETIRFKLEKPATSKGKLNLFGWQKDEKASDDIDTVKNLQYVGSTTTPSRKGTLDCFTNDETKSGPIDLANFQLHCKNPTTVAQTTFTTSLEGEYDSVIDADTNQVTKEWDKNKESFEFKYKVIGADGKKDKDLSFSYGKSLSKIKCFIEVE
ncbi:MAG: hypothetical protein HOE90_14255 [Bacteriovoracaceae bacterium]|jgi:hypothetical protein|nr:hypothetical protein [Bacteriovoracaceae bacterium]